MSLSCAFEKDGTVSTEKESAGLADPAKANGPLAILTTGVWKRESMFMRYLELNLVNAVRKWSKPKSDEPLESDTARFVREVPEPLPPKSWFGKTVDRFKRT